MQYKDAIALVTMMFPEFKAAANPSEFARWSKSGAHVLFANFFPFFLDQYRRGVTGDRGSMQVVQRILLFLELLALEEEEPEYPNLVQISFLDYLPWATPEEAAEIRSRLLPKTLELLEQYEAACSKASRANPVIRKPDPKS